MNRICVFCASSIGNNKNYETAAYEVGKLLALKNIEVVYGGGNVGLMGTVANAALSHNGKVIGVIPEILMTKEVAHMNLTELHVVKNMHARKMMMHELSDGVITLPGGFGTFEEFFEMLTWAQLGVHSKPIALFNVDGYYDHLLKFIDHAVAEGLLKSVFRDMIIVSNDVRSIVEAMLHYIPPITGKWMSESDT
jgi:uncharacterized protein (TIGR00730 family)